jgi:microcystin-dependent protein
LRGPFIGEIAPFPTPTLPAGWMPCDGRTLQIRDFMALFSIIGTMYGGDGSTNFALPNLSGRAPIGAGLPRYSDEALKVGQTVNTPATGAKVEKQKVVAAAYAIAVKGIFPSRR